MQFHALKLRFGDFNAISVLILADALMNFIILGVRKETVNVQILPAKVHSRKILSIYWIHVLSPNLMMNTSSSGAPQAALPLPIVMPSHLKSMVVFV